MLLGEYSHSLDTKGRIILPVKYREQFKTAVLTSEIDRCLGLWTPADFQEWAEQLRPKLRGTKDERDAARFFFSGAQDTAPDSQGRIAIPPHLRDFAQLDREVVINGAWDHLEIWDAAIWQARKAAGELVLAEGPV